MDLTADIPVPAQYRDRRRGLIGFGILEIALGGLSLLSLAGLFLARVMSFAVVVYGLGGAALIWLGIGSILCRRWARALLLIGSWSWLVGGVIALGFYAGVIRDLFAAADPAGWLAVGIGAVFFIALPGALVLFYRSPEVQATCEARDPRSRWTDRCPLPVLACSLWLGLGTCSLLATPGIYRDAVPCFGFFLSGAPAALVLLIYAAFGFYLAWGTYRLRISAWWMTLAAFTLFDVSSAVTFLRVDRAELYRRLGYSKLQIDGLGSVGFFSGAIMAWWIAAIYLLFLIYLTWIRKYFRRARLP
jgi:MFS family permease